VNSENALAQFTLIRRNRRSSSGFSRNLRKEVSKQEKSYFWRVHTGAEIDIVEEREGEIYAYECKWSRPAGQPAARARAPQGVVPGRLPRRVVRGHHSRELPGVSGRVIVEGQQVAAAAFEMSSFVGYLPCPKHLLRKLVMSAPRQHTGYIAL